MSTEEEKNGITVYIANLGKYNEGELVGKWITLPVPQAELDRFLREEIGLELNPQAAYEKGMHGERVYEEYVIHDYEYDKDLEAIGYKPHEYTNLDDLNILAGAIAGLSDYEQEAVRLCIDQSLGCNPDPLECANLALQADEIPYYNYDFFGIEHSAAWSNEEKLGYTLMEGSPVIEQLEAMDMDQYFDYEEYGRDNSHDLVLTDNGYLDCTADFPDENFYDRDELKELVADRMGNPDFFKEQPVKPQPEQNRLSSLADRVNGIKENLPDRDSHNTPEKDMSMDAR